MELARSTPDLDRITLAGNVADVPMHNRLVVSAITETIDLEAPEFADIDLTGTVRIDDNQPGSVDRAQLEARGGQVLWVAGRDDSATGFMTRDGPHTGGIAYTYGGSSGLYGGTTEFACGLEAAVVAASKDRANAVAGPVSLADVERIGALFTHYGVGIAPFQSFGQPVDLR